MNILLINHEKGGGGASFSLYELIIELLKKGHNIYVLTPYKEGSFIDKLSQFPIHILVEPYTLWVFKKSDFLTSIKARIKYLISIKRVNIESAKRIAVYSLNNKIDFIHSNTSTVNIGALISKFSGIPHIWHLREFGDFDIGTAFFELQPILYSFMNKYTCKFICVSEAVCKYYNKLAPQKKVVVYNGVSLDNLIETDHCSEDNTVNILIAGHIFEYKGQHEAVEACSMLLDQGVDNFVLNMVGQGDLYFEIPKKLRPRVNIYGEVDNLRELRKTMDIELCCSKCEAFGRVIVEGMLGGLTVIGTNNGGIPELIHHGENGFLYDQGNVSALSNLLGYLIENPDVRKNVGNTAREYAKEKFLISRCADEIEQIYKEVIK